MSEEQKITKKVFISLPMRNRDIFDIRARMRQLLDIVNERFIDDYELIDTLWPEDEPTETRYHTFYLGKSISAMSEADLVIFDKDWSHATGCIVEYNVCRMYDIPYYLVDPDSENDRYSSLVNIDNDEDNDILASLTII